MAVTGDGKDFICKKCLEDSSHILYHQLSKKNTEINMMKREELIKRLQQLHIDSGGTLEILKKRLKSYYKNEILHLEKNEVNFPYLCVIDFEATCELEMEEYPQEIIEFPAVLIDTKRVEVVDEFQMYCKPILNPVLSAFCIELTGITQETVDASEEFPKVLECFEHWMDKHKLGTDFTFAVVTDGPCDLGRFLKDQCALREIPFPSFGLKWINIRKSFSNFYKTKRMKLKLMLDYLGLQFEGNPHSGLDDSRNIARIVLRMIRDGSHLRLNDKIEGESVDSSKPKKNRTYAKKDIVDLSLANPNDYLGVDPDTLGFEKLLLAHK